MKRFVAHPTKQMFLEIISLEKRKSSLVQNISAIHLTCCSSPEGANL